MGGMSLVAEKKWNAAIPAVRATAVTMAYFDCGERMHLGNCRQLSCHPRIKTNECA